MRLVLSRSYICFATTHFNKTFIYSDIFQCTQESTSNNQPKSQLNIGILILIIIIHCKTQRKFLQVDETYINKRCQEKCPREKCSPEKCPRENYRPEISSPGKLAPGKLPLPGAIFKDAFFLGVCKLLVLISFLIFSSLSFTFYLRDNFFWSQFSFFSVFFFGGWGAIFWGAFSGVNFPP